MPDIAFTEDERQLLVVLTTQAWVRIADDPAMRENTKECASILKKLMGTDTVLISRKP